MKEKKRFEITFETHELTIVRFGRNKTTEFCAVCRRYTPHLSVIETLSALSLTEAEIIRLTENGQIHSRETADGRLLLCAGSLAHLASG